MRKLILSLSLLCWVSLSAQSLSLNADESYHSLAGETCEAHFDVVNTSSDTLDIIVTRSMNLGDDIVSTFCWGETCYTPATDVSAQSITIEAGASFDGFTGYIYNMPADTSFMINYCFSVVDNPSDKVCVDITYSSFAQSVGIVELDSNLSVYPNPANDKLYLNYEGSSEATFVLYDMLGNKILVDNLSGSTEIYVSDYQSGIYFYTFEIEGAPSEVQKLVISH